jgi:hypothetical protein
MAMMTASELRSVRKVGVHVQQLRHADAEREHDAGADERIEDDAHRAVREVEPVGEEHAVRHRRERREAEDHQHAQRERARVLAPYRLGPNHRRAHHQHRHQPAWLQQRPPGGPHH